MSSWNPFKYPPRAVIKSVWGFLLPGLGLLLDAIRENGAITWTDAIVAFLVAAVSGYAVFAAQNTPPGDITPAEAEAGRASLDNLLGIVGVVFILIALLGLFKVLALTLTVVLILLAIGLVLLVFSYRG